MIDISRAVYVQNHYWWWETFKFQNVPIEKHASVCSWRLEALSCNILKNYMQVEKLFSARNFGESGTYQSMWNLGTYTSWFCQTQMNVHFNWVETKSTGICTKVSHTLEYVPLFPYSWDHPLNIEQKPNKIFGYEKRILGPKKLKKLIISKNLNSVIWLNIAGGSHNGPGHLSALRPWYLIQKLATLL